MSGTRWAHARRARGWSLLGAALLSGCATGRFDARRQVDASPLLHVHSYEQMGTALAPGQLAEAMSANPRLAPALDGYPATAMAGTVLGTGGLLAGSIVMLVGTMKNADDVNSGKTTSDSGSSRATLTGAGIMVGGVLLGSIFQAVADRKLLRAVEQHNTLLRAGGTPDPAPPGSPPTQPGAPPPDPAPAPGPGGVGGATPWVTPYLVAATGPQRRMEWHAGLRLRF